MLPSSSTSSSRPNHHSQRAAHHDRPSPFDLASSSSSSSSDLDEPPKGGDLGDGSDRDHVAHQRPLVPASRTAPQATAATTATLATSEKASLNSTTLVVTPPSPSLPNNSGTSALPPVPPLPSSLPATWTPLTPTMAMSPIQPHPPPPAGSAVLSSLPVAPSDDHHGHHHDDVARVVNLAVSDAQALALALQVAAAASNPTAGALSSANTSSAGGGGGSGATAGGRTPPSSTTIGSAAQRMSPSPSSLSGLLASSNQQHAKRQSTLHDTQHPPPSSIVPASIAPSAHPSVAPSAARSSAIILPYSPSISEGDLGPFGSAASLASSGPSLPVSSSAPASAPAPPGVSSATLDRASQAKSYLSSRYAMIMADPAKYNPLAALRRRLSPHAHTTTPLTFPFGRRERFSVWEVDNRELEDLNAPEPPLPPPSPPGSSRHSGATTSIGSFNPGSSAVDYGLSPIAPSGGDTIASLRSTSPAVIHAHSLPTPHPLSSNTASPSILTNVFRRGSDPGGNGAGVASLLPHPSQLLRRDSSTSRVPSTSGIALPSTASPVNPGRSRNGSPRLGPPQSPPLGSSASASGHPLDLGAPLLPPSNSVVIVGDPDTHPLSSKTSTTHSSDPYLGIDPASLYCGLDVPPVPVSAIRSTLANTLVIPPVFAAHVSDIDRRAMTHLDSIRASEHAANAIRTQLATLTSATAPMVEFRPGMELAETLQVWTAALGVTEDLLAQAKERTRAVEVAGEELVGLVEDLEWAVGGEYLQTIKRLEDSAQGRTASRRRRDDTLLETAYTLLSYLLAGLALLLWAVLLVIRAVRRVAWIVSLPVRFVWSHGSRLLGTGSAVPPILSPSNDAAAPTEAMGEGDVGPIDWVNRVVPSSLSTMAAAAVASEQVMYGSAGRVTEQIERFINPDEWKARIEQLFDAPSTARSPSMSMDPPSSIASGAGAKLGSKGHRRSGSSTSRVSSGGGGGRSNSVPIVSLGRPSARRRTQATNGPSGSPKASPTVIVTAAPQASHGQSNTPGTVPLNPALVVNEN